MLVQIMLSGQESEYQRVCGLLGAAQDKCEHLQTLQQVFHPLALHRFEADYGPFWFTRIWCRAQNILQL